jgi:molybdate transport system substrate-binding protein
MQFSKKSFITTLIIGVLLVILAFTGCNGTASTTTTTSATPKITAVTTTPGATTVKAITAVTSDKEITVFAGSASKPPLDEAAEVFKQQTGIQVYLTYGGSGTVLSQMELSKTGDLYIPGSPDYISKAEKKQLTDPKSTKFIAYLVPVIAVQKGNPQNIRFLSDLAKPGIKIGIGNPASVCVGLYAVEILDYNHLLADVFKNIITQASSCDATATLVSLKSVDAVMGWDVFQSWDPKNIEVVYLKPDQLPRIAYIPAAISTFSKDKASAQAFIDFLTSETGQAIFRKWGYITNEADTKKFAPAAAIGGEYQLPVSYNDLIK